MSRGKKISGLLTMQEVVKILHISDKSLRKVNAFKGRWVKMSNVNYIGEEEVEKLTQTHGLSIAQAREQLLDTGTAYRFIERELHIKQGETWMRNHNLYSQDWCWMWEGVGRHVFIRSGLRRAIREHCEHEKTISVPERETPERKIIEASSEPKPHDKIPEGELITLYLSLRNANRLRAIGALQEPPVSAHEMAQILLTKCVRDVTVVNINNISKSPKELYSKPL